MTVHARGAWVTRALTLPASLPDEDVELVVPDVTPLADAGSVRAVVRGTRRRVVSVQTALAVPETTATPGETSARVRELGRRLERLQSERDRLSAHRQALLELDPEPKLRRAAAVGVEEQDGIAARVADGLAAAGVIDDVLAGVDARIDAIDEKIRGLAEELEAARLADAQASSRARMGSGHPTRRVHIRLAGEGPIEAAEIAYVIPAARWWPVYTVRFTDGGKRATWVHEALVAQLSGEDWAGVNIALSTADLVADARLPELPSRRLGRSQPVARRGYRSPPEGLDRLFAGWDRAYAGVSPPPVAMPQEIEEQAVAQSIDALFGDTEDEVTRPGATLAERRPVRAPRARREGLDKALAGPPLPPPALGAPTPVPAPRTMMAAGVALPAQGGGAGARIGVHDALEPPGPPEPPEPGDDWLDFDALTLAPAEDPVRRGRLVRGGAGPMAARARQAAAMLESREPGPPVVDVLGSRGRFDHRYEAAGAADVPADGAAHRVAIASAEATPRLRYRTVPREVPGVFKEAELVNPFAAPLLAGPVDVYIEGSLLLSTGTPLVDRGGTLALGLGVEDRLRVARNVRTDESSAGLLGGSSVVGSDVTIELASALAAPVTVEVIERVPVTDDRALEIEVTAARPAAEEYTQADRGAAVRGGRRFVVEVPAGGQTQLRYQVRLTFPAKSEIAGGNRRD